jgi:hypothetical protein
VRSAFGFAHRLQNSIEGFDLVLEVMNHLFVKYVSASADIAVDL